MVLSQFQIRPPTPPKEPNNTEKVAEETLDFLKDPFQLGMKEPLTTIHAGKILMNTPQTSPSSEPNDPLSSHVSSKKKVNFHDASQSYIPLNSSPLRSIPRTRTSKPLKSILKPFDAASTPPPAHEGTTLCQYGSFADMLESIVKQLASPIRSSRFDAYHSLQQALQRYEKTPDTQALIDKMGLLTQFIQRDMHATGINGTGLDSQLVGQALKLLIALVRIADVRDAMTDDFCIYVVDRIIQVAADRNLPKVVINIHLAVLMQQNFRPRTMIPARIERILDVLDTIEERVSGLSVQAYRVRIYRKLVMQRPEVMGKHTERWIKHTITALLSNLKDINQSALDTTISAAKAFGNDRLVTKTVLSTLNRVKSDGETVAHGMVKQLQKLLASDHAAMVPQVWSAVTALLPGCLDRQFPALTEWLQLYQLCLNSASEEVKMHAHIAVGFLSYAVQLKEKTTPAWSRMLIRIPQAHFESQRSQPKKPDREAATSAYLALLYHAFAPPTTYKQLDRYWAEFVADFWRPLLRPSPAAPSLPRNAFAACRVVSAVLSNPPRPCDPQRTLELRPQAMLKPEDLPSLDPKWVRKSLASILKFVELLLDVTPWIAEDCKDQPTRTIWSSLLSSLNNASSQEVMVSNEAKEATAHLVNFLRRIWDAHTAQLALTQQKEDCWADKFCFLLSSAVEVFGPARFSDKYLTHNGHDEFEVAATTPSHRSRSVGPRISPLLYFLDLLTNQSEGKLSDSLRLRALNVMIIPCFNAQATRLSKLELLRDCAMLVDVTAGSSFAQELWSKIAESTTSCLTEQSSDQNDRGSRQFGKEYGIVVELISLGFKYLSYQVAGERLLDSFAEAVKSEAGDGAVVLAVVEKVCEVIVKRAGPENSVACLPLLSTILRRLPTSIARRIVEQGRQTLWPSSSNLGRTVEFDPYKYLYEAITMSGSSAHGKLNADNALTIGNFLEALTYSIRHCPGSILLAYLRKSQDVIHLWVEDPDRKLESNTTWVKSVHTSVVHLWQEVCAAMMKIPRDNGMVLLPLETLVTSGFVSRRRRIVQSSIATWNATFGREQTLEYPPRLEEALRRLQGTVKLSLPGLDLRVGTEDISPPFYDSDSNGEAFEPKKQTPRVKETPFRVAKSTRQLRSQPRSPMVSNTKAKGTSVGRTPKARLRHENSQVQFEPIVSSPSNLNNQESQVLTERQREVYERQVRSSNLYADMGSTSTSPLPGPIAQGRSPLEFDSDALNGDDLPIEASRTPLRNVRALGPMDVFVGSSPTPQARTCSQEVMGDRANIATPTAVRTFQRMHVEDLGSSPPRFDKDARSSVHGSQVNNLIQISKSNPHQYDGHDDLSISFDDGPTMDEDNFLTGTPDEDPEAEGTTEMEASGMPGSTLDLQLTAQLVADIQARTGAATVKEPGRLPRHANQNQNKPNTDDDTEGDVTGFDLPLVTSMRSNTETTSTSRVGDSFTSQAAEPENSQVANLRRSHRNPSAPSPQPVYEKKRKPSSGRGPGRPKKIKPGELPDIASVVKPRPDTISTNQAAHSPLPTHTGSTVIVPDTTRVRSLRRSASAASQAEARSEDVTVDDTPAPKRARRSVDKDVSEAKHNTPTASQQLKTQRLRHVQATPKHSEAHSLSTPIEDATVQHRPGGPEAAAGEQKVNVARQLVDATSAASPGPEIQLQGGSNSVATPSRSFAERVFLTPRSIIDKLKEFKDALFGVPQLALNRQEEREADDLMFEIRRAVHAAGARGGEADQ